MPARALYKVLEDLSIPCGIILLVLLFSMVLANLVGLRARWPPVSQSASRASTIWSSTLMCRRFSLAST